MEIQTNEMAVRTFNTPTKDDVSTLKLWFKAEELEGATSISDEVIGLTIPGAVTRTAGDDFLKFISTGGGFSKVAIAETYPAIGSKDFMMVISGNMSGTQNFTIGDIDAVHLRAGTVLGNTLNDGTNPDYAAGAMVAGTVHSWVLTIDEDSATGFNAYQDSLTPQGTDDLVTPNIAAMTLSQFATVDINELYSAMLFVFDNALTTAEWQSALSEGLWMMDQAKNGNKVLSPRCIEWI